MNVAISVISFTVLCKSVQECGYPRIIWSYWDGRITHFIHTVLDEMLQVLGDKWDFKLLNSSTVGEYLNLATFPNIYWSLYPQIQSDYIRLRLLKEYGGWWIDVPTLITSDTLLDDFYQIATSQNLEYFGFSNHYYGGAPYLETGIMYARINSTIIDLWFKEIDTLLMSGITQYMYDVSRKGVYLPPPVYHPYPYIDGYFAVYACSAIVLERLIDRKTQYFTHDVNQYYYKMINDCKWSRGCIRKLASNKTRLYQYPIIKFNWPARQAIDREYKKTFHRIPVSVNTHFLPTTLSYHTGYLISLFVFSMLMPQGLLWNDRVEKRYNSH